MRGYVAIDTELIDPDADAEFLSQAPAAVVTNGGQFIVRSGDAETIEVNWAPKRLVIAEVDNLEAAKGFVGSEEYVALSDIRHKAANSNVVVAQGLD
ncbi:MAG: DUF1330 domain-containing protein [Chloroflexi bacterium]|nr:DUF1330 domain-containing protein [Chloroflexota bacterium]